ncbi:alpha/beta fold hydrolase [Agromyces sp. SYSU T0242]|uniref:alpha/beta fold hydrolase n=1 Tax=Agromyces litoreus TaxID=3158561 RepID=UPI0033988591
MSAGAVAGAPALAAGPGWGGSCAALPADYTVGATTAASGEVTWSPPAVPQASTTQHMQTESNVTGNVGFDDQSIGAPAYADSDPYGITTAGGTFSEHITEYWGDEVETDWKTTSSSITPSFALELDGSGAECRYTLTHSAMFDTLGTFTDQFGSTPGIPGRGGLFLRATGILNPDGTAIADFHGAGVGIPGVSEETIEENGVSVSGAFQGVTVDASITIGPMNAPMPTADLRVEQLDVPSTTEWIEVDSNGVIDGNVLRLTALVDNPGDADEVTIEIRDETDGTVIVPPTVRTAEPGPNEYEFGWDTEDRAWADDGTPATDPMLRLTLRTGAGLVDEATMTFPVVPKPVVLVHGWNSSAAGWAGYADNFTARHPDWKAFAVGDGQYPGVMDTGSIIDPMRRGKTLVGNSRELATYVEAVRDDLEAQQVDLVAHSMGGLISRRYLAADITMTDDLPAVEHLLQLGTPNLGSPCSDIIPSLSAIELQPGVLVDFNLVTRETRGVKLAIMAGDPWPTTCGLGGEGDGVVEVASAFGLPYITDRQRVGTLHTSMTESAADFTSFVAPRLIESAATATATATATANAQLRAAESASESGTPGSPLITDSSTAMSFGDDSGLVTAGDLELEASGERVIEFGVGDEQAISATILAAPGVVGELIGPDGAVRTSTADDPASAGAPFRTTAVVDGPTPGSWQLRVTSPGTEPTTVGFGVTFRGSSLALAVGTETDPETGAVTAIAELTGGSSAPDSVEGLLLGDDGTRSSIAFTDDGTGADAAAGDGRYSAALVAPDAERRLLLVIARSDSGDRAAQLSLGGIRLVAGDGEEPSPSPRPTNPPPTHPAPTAGPPTNPRPTNPPPTQPAPTTGPPTARPGRPVTPPPTIAPPTITSTDASPTQSFSATTAPIAGLGGGTWAGSASGSAATSVTDDAVTSAEAAVETDPTGFAPTTTPGLAAVAIGVVTALAIGALRLVLVTARRRAR